MEEKKEPMLKCVAPIKLTEAESDEEKKVFIEGDAIVTGVSRNNVDYTSDVLKAAARTLIGRPLMLGHGDADVRNIVGKVMDAEFTGNKLPFKAEIDKSEEWLVNKLKNGFVNKVSIGADTIDENGKHYDPEPDDDGIIRPKGIEFLELSLVPIPGVKDASINQVIAESYKKRVKEMTKEKEKEKDEQIEELKKENEALRNKLAEEESEDESSEDSSDDSREKAKEPEEKPKESKEVETLKEQMKTLTEKVSKLTEKPRGVASEKSKMKKDESGIKIHMQNNPQRGVDIFSVNTTERAKPGSGRRWELY